MEKLVELLSGMTGVRHWGGSYPNNPYVHADELHQPEQVMQGPHICVEEDNGTSMETVGWMETVGAEGSFASKFRVVIYGHLIATADARAGTWRRRLR